MRLVLEQTRLQGIHLKMARKRGALIILFLVRDRHFRIPSARKHIILVIASNDEELEARDKPNYDAESAG